MNSHDCKPQIGPFMYKIMRDVKQDHCIWVFCWPTVIPALLKLWSVNHSGRTILLYPITCPAVKHVSYHHHFAHILFYRKPLNWTQRMQHPCTLWDIGKWLFDLPMMSLLSEWVLRLNTPISYILSMHYFRLSRCYFVADMSWYTKKVAAVIFATPPTSTFEEALNYFLMAESG